MSGSRVRDCLSSNAGRGEGGGAGVLRKGCTGQVLNSPFPRWAHRQSEGSRAGEAGGVLVGPAGSVSQVWGVGWGSGCAKVWKREGCSCRSSWPGLRLTNRRRRASDPKGGKSYL